MKSIKFNQQGMQGIQSGVKTMTRRPIKVRTDITKQAWIDTLIPDYCKCKVGETVFVQEDFYKEANYIEYKADFVQGENLESFTWFNASEMKEHQARFFLKIKSIKVERLQDISDEDCEKEGVRFFNNGAFNSVPQEAFEHQIWNNLPYQAPYDWNSNPYVFVYEFERVAS